MNRSLVFLHRAVRQGIQRNVLRGALGILVLLTAGCASGSLEYLNDLRLWPTYLPEGVTIEGECPDERYLTIRSKVDSEGGEPLLIIHMIDVGQEYDVSSLSRGFSDFVPDFPPQSAEPTTVRRIDGLSWQRIREISDDMATGVAWQEGPNLFSVEGVGMSLDEVEKVAEGLEPSFARWFGCDYARIKPGDGS